MLFLPWSRSVFSRLWSWLRPQWWAVLLMPMSDLLAFCTMTVMPLIIARAIDGPITHKDYDGIWFYAFILLALAIAQAMFFAMRFLPTPAIIDAEMAIRRNLFAHVQRLSMLHHNQHGSGVLLSRLIGDVTQVAYFVHTLVPWTISTTVTLGFTAIILIAIHPLLGSFVVVALIPLGFASNFFQKRFYSAAQEVRESAAAVATAAEESALAVRVLKSLGGSRFISQRFGAAAVRSRDGELAQIRLSAWFNAFMTGYPIVVWAIVVVGGGAAVAQGSLSVGIFVAFAASYFRILTPVTQFGRLLFLYQVSKNALVRVITLFDTPVQIIEPRQPKSLPDGEALDFSFDDVHFAYPGAENDTLRGVDLHIPAGQTLALVGVTGSGKSLVTALAARLIDPIHGRVRLGEIDLRDLKLADIQSSVGVAFEEARLFSGSIADNLIFGRTDVSESEMKTALAVTQSTFVYGLPDGLATIVGERGFTLSGGQRQRLALARALIGHPRVLILDDPMSALDLRTEEALTKSLRDAFGHITTLIVARRPSTAILADRVALLEGGRIVAIGTHDELLASSIAYRHVMIAAPDKVEEATGSEIYAHE